MSQAIDTVSLEATADEALPEDRYTPSDEDAAYPVTTQGELKAMSVALEWLTELQYTIGRQGVSQHDMQTLHEIRDSMTQQGVTFGPTPSLENYPVRSYTDDRSSLNLTVAQESIGRTIIATIKTWIRKLIEYITKVVRWFKKTLANDQSTEFQLQRAAQSITTRRVKLGEFERTFRVTLTADEERQLVEFATRHLSDPALPRNALTLAALGNRDQELKLRELEVATRSAVSNLTALVKDLVRWLEADDERDLSLDPEVLSQVGVLVQQAKLFQEVSPDEGYLTKQVDATSVFQGLLSASMRKVTPTDYLVTSYETMGDTLRRMRRISEGEGDPVVLNRLFQDLNTTIDNVAHLAVCFGQYNQAKAKVLTQMDLYEQRRYHLVKHHALNNAVSEKQKEAIEAFKDKVLTPALKRILGVLS